MAHPQHIQDAWDDLAPFPQPIPLTEADYPTVDDLVAAVAAATPSKVVTAAIAALEEAGFDCHITADGTVWADMAAPADRDGQTYLHGSLRITQEA